jgi:hypothetical protein
MKFKNKSELIQFVKQQTNILLPNETDNILNKKRNILYTEISNKFAVLDLLNKYNINYELHVHNNYFIFIK